MRIVFSILLFWHACICAVTTTDYDCVVIGTSPFSMLEALYQHHSGHRVLILDEAETYGGAWRSISICGIENVDMGCHEIGCQREIKQFLEDYVGCKLVSLDDPRHFYMDPPPADSKGFYPSKGCHELVENLKKLIQAADMEVLLGHKLDSVYLNSDKNIAEIKAKDKRFTTPKIIATPASVIHVENFPEAPLNNTPCSHKHHHLYLLVEDSTAPRFTYEDDIVEEASRGANLTWYVGLEGSGMQLIVIQTHDEAGLANGEGYLEALKQKNYLAPDARILRMETYIYEQCYTDSKRILELGSDAQMIFEIMDTWNFGSLCSYIDKWKEILKPYKEALNLSFGGD
jgi:hypothetical protein